MKGWQDVIERLDPDFLYRMPDRVYERGHITHMQVHQMNRRERRLVAKDAIKNPDNYQWTRSAPNSWKERR